MANQVTSEEAMKGFRALHPAFEACWQRCLVELEDLAESLAYGYFAAEIRDLLASGVSLDCVKVMGYVEKLMCEGSEDVEYVVCVWLIEGLLSQADEDPEIMAPVLRLLGPRSRSYALEWNKSNGARNKGLEEEEKSDSDRKNNSIIRRWFKKK